MIPLPLYASRQSSAAPGTLLFDLYPGGYGYSVRKLRTAYSGPCMKVRRMSDGTLLDIGFSGVDLDTAALAAFCAGTDGYVRTWYEQGINANHAIQTGAWFQMPQIVTAGSVFTRNVKPTLIWTPSSNQQGFNLTAPISAAGPFSTFMVTYRATTYTILGFVGSPGSNGGYAYATYQTSGYVGTTTRYSQYTDLATGQALYAAIAHGSLQDLFRNGTQQTPAISNGTLSGTDFVSIGNRYDGFVSQSDQQESVIWTSDQSANRAAIESNIRTYFGF